MEKHYKPTTGMRLVRVAIRGLLPMLALLSVATGLHAQNLTVTGKVTDQSGVPIIGAIVSVQGTNNGTITNAGGDYVLEVPAAGAVLEYSALGYARATQTPGSRGVVNVQLTETAVDLEEVVVVGYGVMRKRDLTGSVSTVNAETLAKEQPQTVQDLLRNNIPGLTMGMNTSAEGNQTNLVIRGKTNFRSDGKTENDPYNAPLIVLDNAIFYGRLTDINPNDIERLDVLKDSSSAAIYGAKASNGVIIITTKKGTQGKPMISLSATVGMQMIGRATPWYTGEDFVDYRRDVKRTTSTSAGNFYDDPRSLSGQALTDWMGGASGEPVDVWLTRLGFSPSMAENYKAGRTTNLRNLLFDKVALRQDYTLSVSGRAGETSYYTSIGYTDNAAQLKNSGFRSIKARMNLDSKINDHVVFGVNASYANQERGFVSPDNGDVSLSPYAQYTNPDGSWKLLPDDSFVGNPIINYHYLSRMDNTHIINASGFLRVLLPFGFSVETRFSPYISMNQYYDSYSSENPNWAGTTNNRVNRNNNNYFNWQWDNLLKWNKQFGEHSLDFTYLMNWEERNS